MREQRIDQRCSFRLGFGRAGDIQRQIEELKAQAQRAADVLDYAQAAAILERVPSKHRNEAHLTDWMRKRDRLAELWRQVEGGWRDMTEDELNDNLEEVLVLHPDHPQAQSGPDLAAAPRAVPGLAPSSG
jgi:hypothetical protein